MELTKEVIELFEEVLFEVDPNFPVRELYRTAPERHETYTGNLLFRRIEKAYHWMVPTGPIWPDKLKFPYNMLSQVFMIREDGELVRAYERPYVDTMSRIRPQDHLTPSRVVSLEELSINELHELSRGFRFWIQHK